jgi:hypothetical protein
MTKGQFREFLARRGNNTMKLELWAQVNPGRPDRNGNPKVTVRTTKVPPSIPQPEGWYQVRVAAKHVKVSDLIYENQLI